MTVQISLFNHKGGVSKTTTAFNLGWKLATKNKRVLLVDCDPQCNLTGMVLGFKAADEFEKVYASEGVRNIKEGLAPAFESRQKIVSDSICLIPPSSHACPAAPFPTRGLPFRPACIALELDQLTSAGRIRAASAL